MRHVNVTPVGGVSMSLLRKRDGLKGKANTRAKRINTWRLWTMFVHVREWICYVCVCAYGCGYVLGGP